MSIIETIESEMVNFSRRSPLVFARRRFSIVEEDAKWDGITLSVSVVT